jgi:4-hydroxy-2-oxoheptanedioate aldolase
VWPLAPDGEILVVLMIEDTAGMAALPDILKDVPGVGAVLIGEGDLSQELGYPRQYEHPVVLEAMAEIVNTCKKNKVAVGHPHMTAGNVERLLSEGYTFMMTAVSRSTPGLDKALKLTGRSSGKEKAPSDPAPSY